MERHEYEIMYRIEDGFWWYRGLHDWILRELAAVPSPGHLDAGCGTGKLLELCAAHHPVGVDLSADALTLARRRGPFALARASLVALPFAAGSFDVVTSADVLSEIGAPADAAAVSELHRVLKPGGRLILNLPAYRGLASRHDRAVNTRRRYSAAELAALLCASGFTLRTLTYRLCLLFPALALARLLARAPAAGQPARSDLAPLPAPIDALLTLYLKLENRLIARGVRLPFGLSLAAVAEKPGPISRLEGLEPKTVLALEH